MFVMDEQRHSSDWHMVQVSSYVIHASVKCKWWSFNFFLSKKKKKTSWYKFGFCIELFILETLFIYLLPRQEWFDVFQAEFEFPYC